MYYRTKKYLTWAKLRICGRNNKNQVVSYHRGGGSKRLYRIIDSKRYIWNIYGVVSGFIFDVSQKTILIAIIYMNGFFSYILAFEHAFYGYYIFASNIVNYNSIGYCLWSKNVIAGNYCHNIFLYENRGGKYIKTNGNFGRIVTNTKKWCLIKLRSRFFIKLFFYCNIVIGKLKKEIHFNKKKASYFFYKGWRPVVRGVCMNPIDHPHGGGQGKTSGGRPSCSRWGIYTKGRKTRNIKRRGNFIHSYYVIKNA